MFLAVDLAVDLIAGSTCARHAASTIATVGASTLSHEARNHTVKGKTVIEAILRKLHKIGDRLGCIGLEQLELDQACFGIHQGLGHGGTSKIGV